MKRVRFKPISYLGLIFIAIAVFGDDVFNIKNPMLEYGLIILGIVGVGLAIKGKEIYESFD